MSCIQHSQSLPMLKIADTSPKSILRFISLPQNSVSGTISLCLLVSLRAAFAPSCPILSIGLWLYHPIPSPRYITWFYLSIVSSYTGTALVATLACLMPVFKVQQA